MIHAVARLQQALGLSWEQALFTYLALNHAVNNVEFKTLYGEFGVERVADAMGLIGE